MLGHKLQEPRMTATRMATSKKEDKNKCQRGGGEAGVPVHRW